MQVTNLGGGHGPAKGEEFSIFRMCCIGLILWSRLVSEISGVL